MRNRWEEALDAVRSANAGSDRLDLQVYAARQGETFPAPHYTQMYFEQACSEGERVRVTTNPAHAMAFLDEIAEGCNIEMARVSGGWTASLTHPEHNIRQHSGVAREEMGLAIVVAALRIREPYHDAEMAKLERQDLARKTLQSGLPEQQEDPREELKSLGLYLRRIGREGLVSFDAENGVSDLTASLSGPGPDIDADLSGRLTALAAPLIACEIPDWDQNFGSSGTLRIIGPEEVWISADDRNDDWSLSRDVDLDALGEPDGDMPSP